MRFQKPLVIVAPTDARRKKLVDLIDKHLETDTMSSSEAEHLAGSLQFLFTSTFGAVGASPLQSIYARVKRPIKKLNPGVREALRALKTLVSQAPPRCLNIGTAKEQATVVYGDAFFEMQGRTVRNAEKHAWPNYSVPTKGGWGATVVADDGCWVMAGTITQDDIALFGAQKKTYIFFLEALAQCVTLWVLGAKLGRVYWSFVDNTAAEFALKKGYSGDKLTNSCIALYWLAAMEVDALPWFERVPSAAQLADCPSRGGQAVASRLGTRAVVLRATPMIEFVSAIAKAERSPSRDDARKLLEIASREWERALRSS